MSHSHPPTRSHRPRWEKPILLNRMPSVSHLPRKDSAGEGGLFCCHHKATKPRRRSLSLKMLAKCGHAVPLLGPSG